jgi:hypothetical protein
VRASDLFFRRFGNGTDYAGASQVNGVEEDTFGEAIRDGLSGRRTTASNGIIMWSHDEGATPGFWAIAASSSWTRFPLPQGSATTCGWAPVSGNH